MGGHKFEGFKAKFRFNFCCVAAMEITEEEEKEDRISLLPDCLLTEILSRLPSTKDAIRTSSLSKRWKYLWNYVPSLTFEYSDHKPQHWWGSECFSSIDKTLAQCRQLKLRKLYLNNRYDSQFDSQISNWVRFALSCNVEELDLKLASQDSSSKFVLDESIFISSCLTNLNLADCELNPTGAISWKNLNSLYISRAKLDEDLIENILSGSPALETLTLDFCYGYKRLDITSKSVKNLVISGYTYDDDDDPPPTLVEINAPYILSLRIESNLFVEKVLLLNVSGLVKAHLDFKKSEYLEETLKGFILKLRHVNELKIGKSCSQALPRLDAQGFIFPSNMKFSDVIP